MLISQLLEPPGDFVPYAILLANYIFFNTLRRIINALLIVKREPYTKNNTDQQQTDKRKQQATTNKQQQQTGATTTTGLKKGLKLFIGELISTCELCAQCAELNVVYERHGSWAYGIALACLTHIWLNTFGDAHTTPGYLAEDICLATILVKPKQSIKQQQQQREKTDSTVLRSALTYARLGAQLLAMPLAWRFASIYWRYQLVEEHKQLLHLDKCRSSLATSTLLGLAIELICSLLCRLLELQAAHSIKMGWIMERTSNLLVAILSSGLVVLALDSSGGYFNPVLASSLEFGCAGADFSQHLLVFWLGPLVGHVLARLIHERLLVSSLSDSSTSSSSSSMHSGVLTTSTTASSNQRKQTKELGSPAPRPKPLPSPIVRRVTRRSSRQGLTG